MPLIRRVPKRGFRNLFAREMAIVNVSDLDRFEEGTVVTPELLREMKRIRKAGVGLKVLGGGELTRKLVVHAHQFSAAARSKIEAVGGRVEVLPA